MVDALEHKGGTDRSPEHLDEDVCLSLVHGLLPAARVESILDHVRTCAACERLLRDSVIDRERLRARYRLHLGPGGEVLASPRQAEGAAPEQVPSGHRDQGEPRHWWHRWVSAGRPRQLGFAGLAVAAAAILMVLVLPRIGDQDARLLLPRMSPMSADAAGEIRFEPLGGGLSPDDFYTGMAAYESGQFDRAVSLLSQAQVPERWEIPRKLYLANALAQRGEYRASILLLRSIDLSVLPEPWGLEAEQTLCVALQAAGETASADSLRREITRRMRSAE